MLTALLIYEPWTPVKLSLKDIYLFQHLTYSALFACLLRLLRTLAAMHRWAE